MCYTEQAMSLPHCQKPVYPVTEDSVGRPRKYKAPVNQSVTFNATELDTIRAEARRQSLPVSELIRRRLLQSLGIPEDSLEEAPKRVRD